MYTYIHIYIHSHTRTTNKTVNKNKETKKNAKRKKKSAQHTSFFCIFIYIFFPNKKIFYIYIFLYFTRNGFGPVEDPIACDSPRQTAVLTHSLRKGGKFDRGIAIAGGRRRSGGIIARGGHAEPVRHSGRHRVGVVQWMKKEIGRARITFDAA